MNNLTKYEIRIDSGMTFSKTETIYADSKVSAAIKAREIFSFTGNGKFIKIKTAI